MQTRDALRAGIGGPVGSGKTALTLALCHRLRHKFNMAVVTNDIYTREDAERAKTERPDTAKSRTQAVLIAKETSFGSVLSDRI